nr:hypothetical protein [uncultured Blautia sp.]
MTLIDTFFSDFSDDCTQTLAKQVLLGTTAYKKFFHTSKDFFSYPEYSSLRGYLLNYSVQKTLYDSAFVSTSLYKAIPMKVNNYGCSVLHIRTDNFQLTTAKTPKWNSLPAKSKYKLRYASANTGCDGQYSFDFVNEQISSAPYYAVLTYGYNMLTNDCTHIDLVVPDSSFTNILYRKDLLLKNNKELLILPTEKEVDDAIVSLNAEFESIVRLKAQGRES